MPPAMDLELTCRNLLWLACMRCLRVPWRLRVILPEMMEAEVSPRTTGDGPTVQTSPQENPADSDDAQPAASLPPLRPADSSVARPEAGQTRAQESPADSSASLTGAASSEAAFQTEILPPSPPEPPRTCRVRGTQPRARRQLFCPDCASRMVLRQNRMDKGWFYGCSRFPECRGTLPSRAGGVPPGAGGVDSRVLCAKSAETAAQSFKHRV